MKMESYRELKEKQSKELNDFQGIFFAFNNNQFREGMQSIGLKENEKDKIYSFSNTGGFILKEKSKALHNILDRHSAELKQRQKDEKFLINSLVYELNNHEYCITYDVTEALNTLGLEEKDIPAGILKKACKIALNQVF